MKMKNKLREWVWLSLFLTSPLWGLLLLNTMVSATPEQPVFHQQIPVTIDRVKEEWCSYAIFPVPSPCYHIQFSNGERRFFFRSEVWAEKGDGWCAIKETPNNTLRPDLYDWEYIEGDCAPMAYWKEAK